MNIALIVNPWAGVGGAVALKGSDHIRELAMAKGAVARAGQRTLTALESFVAEFRNQRWMTCRGAMGGDILEALGLPYAPLKHVPAAPTEAADTIAAAREALAAGADLILFTGGDGTARDICAAVGEQIPVLGIPAGVKIHSAVYGVTPHASGELLHHIISGGMTDIREQEVRDIDEAAFRQNQVRSRYFGSLKVPVSGGFVQHTKQGGIESEELVLLDIADSFTSDMEDDIVYFIGSGRSTAFIMEQLELPYTLLGVDAVQNGRVICADADAGQLLALAAEHECRLLISIIGGQGHIFGRGNQQLSPELIRRLGRQNIQVLATRAKLKSLEGRPLIVDTGDRQLDLELEGQWELLTGYQDISWYPVATY